MHTIAAKAVAFKEAMSPGFTSYQRQIVKNAKELASALSKYNFRIVSGGTDTHLMLVDLTARNITGKEASSLLGDVNITVNKNLIPFDKLAAGITSGIRVGTPAVTTRGFKEAQMRKIARFINDAVEFKGNAVKLSKVKKGVVSLAGKFPLYKKVIKW
jgi:glycine hydroxymethyltransferase